jgi:type VI secretion system protein ImpH
VGNADREAIHSLVERLQKEGHHFAFFQAVYLLEQYCSSVGKIAHVGEQGPANIECIRFRPDVSMAFPLSDIVSVEKTDVGGSAAPRFMVTTSFFGLYGSNSPLPDFYAEEILQADYDETNVRDFLDLFHHRLLSLLYRCWLKYHYHIQFLPNGEDDFSRRIFSLAGMGTSGLKEQLKIPAVRLLRYVGLFMQQNRSASGLECLLSDYFNGIPVNIEQCVGRWVKISVEDQSFLGKNNSQLGAKVTIGEMVFDRSGKFRITINVTNYQEFKRFLPNGDYFLSVKEIASAYLPAPLDFEVELILSGSEVPKLDLGSGDAQLGWTGWLTSETLEEDVSVIFQAN